jgi:hypothetical protein
LVACQKSDLVTRTEAGFVELGWRFSACPAPVALTFCPLFGGETWKTPSWLNWLRTTENESNGFISFEVWFFKMDYGVAGRRAAARF